MGFGIEMSRFSLEQWKPRVQVGGTAVWIKGAGLEGYQGTRFMRAGRNRN